MQRYYMMIPIFILFLSAYVFVLFKYTIERRRIENSVSETTKMFYPQVLADLLQEL